MADWLAMGGHAAFIWPAYGLSFLALLALTGEALMAHRRASRSDDLS